MRAIINDCLRFPDNTPAQCPCTESGVPVFPYELLVHLDGKPIDCVAADEESGEVLVYTYANPVAALQMESWESLSVRTGLVELTIACCSCGRKFPAREADRWAG